MNCISQHHIADRYSLIPCYTGGFDGSSHLDGIYSYDPVDGTWSPAGKLVQGRAAHAVSTVPAEEVYHLMSDLCA